MSGFGSFVSGLANGYKFSQDRDSEAQRNELAGLQINEAKRKIGEDTAIRGAYDTNMAAAEADAARINAQQVQGDGGVKPATSIAGAGVTTDPAYAKRLADEQTFIDGKKPEVTAGYSAPGVGFTKDYGDARDLATQEGAGLTSKRPKVTAADIFSEKYSDGIYQEYVKAGRIPEAQAFQGFMESQDGKRYGRAWADATLALQQGNIKGSIDQLETLYNKGLPDGKFVKITPEDDGQTFTVTQYDEASGAPISAKSGSAQDIASMGIHSLAPEKRVSYMLTAQAAAAKDAAQERRDDKKAAHAIELQDKKDAGLEKRTGMNNATLLEGIDRRVSGAADVAEMRANAKSKGLTEPQQRTNEEILGARQRMGADGGAGYIKKDDPRLQPRTATGLPNMDYDPELARDVKNAQRRLHGNDPQYDAWTKSRTQANQRVYKVGDKSFNDTDIAETARKYGMTVEATKAKLGIK